MVGTRATRRHEGSGRTQPADGDPRSGDVEPTRGAEASLVRAVTYLALAAGVALLAVSIGLGLRDRGEKQRASDQALTSKAADQATRLEEYFARARSIMLITAQNPSFRSFYSNPGSRREKIEARTPAVRESEKALAYLETLYPASIGEACFIDRSGPENARYVRGQKATIADLSPDETGSPFFAPTFAPQGRRGVPSDALCLTGHRRVGDLQLDAGAGHRLPRGRDRPLRSHRRIVSTHRSRDRETGRCGGRRREDRADHPRQPLRAKAGPAARATVRHAIRGPRVLGGGHRLRHDRRASRRVPATFAGRPQCQRLVRGRGGSPARRIAHREHRLGPSGNGGRGARPARPRRPELPQLAAATRRGRPGPSGRGSAGRCRARRTTRHSANSPRSCKSRETRARPTVSSSGTSSARSTAATFSS